MVGLSINSVVEADLPSGLLSFLVQAAVEFGPAASALPVAAVQGAGSDLADWKVEGPSQDEALLRVAFQPVSQSVFESAPPEVSRQGSRA